MDEILRTKQVAPRESKRTVVMDVRDIAKSLPLGREHIEILRGMSFQISSGEFVSIVGPLDICTTPSDFSGHSRH